MGKEGQSAIDIVAITPKRLQKISRSFGDEWFNSVRYSKENGKNIYDSTRTLYFLHRHGWLLRRGTRGHYEYRLSGKALTYRRKHKKFTNRTAPLMKRWQT